MIAITTPTTYWIHNGRSPTKTAIDRTGTAQGLVETRQIPPGRKLGLIKLWSKRPYGPRAAGRRGERNALTPVVKHVRFTFDTLPDAFHGFKILHLSDLHIDGLGGLAERVADSLQDMSVDLCVLTGDYRFRTRGSCQQVYPPMARLLASVNARHGTSASSVTTMSPRWSLRLKHGGEMCSIPQWKSVIRRQSVGRRGR